MDIGTAAATTALWMGYLLFTPGLFLVVVGLPSLWSDDSDIEGMSLLVGSAMFAIGGAVLYVAANLL